MLLARYLIEDNTQSHVIYDENVTEDIKLVKSVLRDLVGVIRIPSFDEEQRLFIEISDVSRSFPQFI